MAPWRVVRIAVLGLLLFPECGRAHLVSTGLGPVYDGIGHLLVSPEDLLALLVLALFAGLAGPRGGRIALLGLGLAWLLAAVAGRWLPVGGAIEWLPLAAIFGLGVAVAAGRPARPGLLVVLAVACGGLLGLRQGAAIGLVRGGGLSLVGSTAAMLVLATLVAALSVAARPAWARIVVRIGGSWIAAIGMLMLGWMLRGRF